VDHTFPLTLPRREGGRGGASSPSFEKGRQSEAFSSTLGASGFQISHKAGVLASNNLEKGLVRQSRT